MILPALMFAQELDGKTFFVQSAQEYNKGTNKGYWDVPGTRLRFKDGQNLQVWDLRDKENDRKFRFKYVGNFSGQKYYEIQPVYGYKARVDIRGGHNKNGNNIHLWSRNNSKAQRYRVVHTGNGRWKIYTVHNYVLCLNGRRSSNGTNVHLWEDHNGPWMEWVFRDIHTKKAFGKKNSRVKKPRRGDSNGNSSLPRRKSLQ